MSTQIGLGVPIPKMLPVTGTFLAPLAIYEFVLAVRVGMARGSTKTFWGPDAKDGSKNEHGIDPLNLAVRCHANFVEGVPLALVIAAVAELNGANKRLLTAAFALLTVSRIAHVEFGLRAEKSLGKGRTFGTLTTQGFIVGFGAYATYLVKGYWGF